MEDIKEVMRSTIVRTLHRAGNRHGESLKIPLPAIEIIADELTREVVDLIDACAQEGDG